MQNVSPKCGRLRVVVAYKRFHLYWFDWVYILGVFINGICDRPGPACSKSIPRANPGLNVVQGFWISRLKALPLAVLRNNLKAAKEKLLSENNLLESTLLWIKSELKIEANPGLA